MSHPKKHFKTLSVVVLFISPLLVLADQDHAYQHLAEVMDKYHRTFDVYTDRDAGGNHYYPSHWYNGSDNMTLNTDWRENPHSGFSCVRVEWDGEPGDRWRWNGVMWREPEGFENEDEVPGYDLSGATRLTFRARTNEPGLRIIVIVGYPDDSCGEVRDTVELNDEWAEYEIDLRERNLGHIRGGFGVVFNDRLDPDPDGTTFYLDDIRYDLERPDSLRLLLSFESSNSPADKCCAVNQSYT